MSLKDLPSPNAPNFPLRVREMLHTMLGKTGSADERLLTLREAIASGVVKPGPGGSLVPGDAIGGGTGGEAYVPDLTPPPTPDTLTATPAISHILLEVPAATYTQGHGHLRTRVYGVTRLSGDPAPVFADAVEVGQFSGTVWAFPSNPSTTWHFWAKWESVDGVLSATPVGGTNGVSATTGQDVSSLLDALAGQISTSELATSLATRIDLIDGTGPGSVAQRIADEATARAAAILVETNARTAADTGLQDQINLLAASAGGDLSALLDAVNQERNDRIIDVLDAENAAAAADALLNSALAAEVDARGLADTTLGQVQNLLATQSAAAAAAIVSEQTTRIEQDSAQAKVSQALQVSVGQSAAGLLTEQSARATESAALATNTAVLASRVGDATAAIAEEQSTRANADSAQANVAQVLVAVTQQAAAAIALEQQVRATDDAATATVTQTLAAGIAEADAAIVVEQQVRSTADSSTASQIQSLSAKVGESAAAIQQEQDVRASADLAQAGTVSAMAASVGAAAAAITAEQSVRATDDAAQAAASTALAAAIGDAEAAILAEQQVRTTDDLAIASQSVVLAAQLGSNVAGLVQEAAVRAADDSATAAVSAGILAQAQGATAAISVEQQASASADAAIAGQVTVVGAQLGAQAAAVQVEQTTRATEDAALAAQSTVLRSQAQGSAAALQVEQQVRSDADGAASTQITSLLSQSAGNAAGLLAEQTTRTTEDAALSQQAAVLYAQAGTQAAAVQSEAVTRATDDSAQAAQVQAVSVAAGQGIAAVRSEESARATADTAQAATSTALAASLAGNVAAVVTEQAVRTTEDTSLAQRADVLSAAVASNAAAILTQQQVQVGQDGSLASQISTVAVAAAENEAAIQTEATTRATQTGDLFAKREVKIDLAGHLSGYGLMSQASVNEAPTSAFGIRADQFFVAPPATSSATAPATNLYKGMVWVDTSVTPNVTRYYTGSSWSTTPQALPFVVQTTPQVINGETVQPGIYGENAFFARLVATRGQIGLLAVDDARIANLSVSKLTAGSIAVGQYIQSAGTYTEDGAPTWRIDGNGLAVFNNAVVRGTVYATDGEFTGTVRGATIVGSTITTADSGQRIKMDAEGILFLTGASNGKYGSFKYGSKKYGDGVLVYFNNTVKRVPFYVNSEQNVADIHLYNRAANPPPGEPGDIICVNSRLKTWDGIEGRWRTLAFSD